MTGLIGHNTASQCHNVSTQYSHRILSDSLLSASTDHTRLKETRWTTLATLIPKNFVVADQFKELTGRLLMPITKQPNCQKSVLRLHPDKVQSKDAALAAARRRTLRRAVTHERGGKIEPTAVAVNRSSSEN
jgi:hypothetical protein